MNTQTQLKQIGELADKYVQKVLDEKYNHKVKLKILFYDFTNKYNEIMNKCLNLI